MIERLETLTFGARIFSDEEKFSSVNGWAPKHMQCCICFPNESTELSLKAWRKKEETGTRRIDRLARMNLDPNLHAHKLPNI